MTGNLVKSSLGIFLLIFSVFTGKSQEMNSLLAMPAVSQASKLNPAVRNETEKLIIGVPVISGMNFSWNFNFPLNALFSHGWWNYNFADFFENLPETGEGRTSSDFSLFYASLNFEEFSFNVSLSERMFSSISFDRDVIKLIRDGTEPYFNSDENFGNGSFHFEQFRELSVGISQRYWKDLDIGIRPKLLFGRTYFDAKEINFSVQHDKENNILELKPQGNLILSAPLVHQYDSTQKFTEFSANIFPGDYTFNFHNLGFAIDLGFVYRFSKKSEISASILDLGFTSFKRNAVDVEFTRPIRYTQNTLYQSFNPGAANYLESRDALRAFTDSTSYIMDANDRTQRTYDLTPFTIHFKGRQQLSPTLRAGISDQLSYYKNHSFNLLSGFVSKNVERWQFGGSLSVYNLSRILLGAGVSYTGQSVQYYVSSNNIWGIIQPAGSKHLNLSVGINFLFDTVRK